MDVFIEFANDMFRENNVGAYTFAAWIHHTLINIHPFEDGNGRITHVHHRFLCFGQACLRFASRSKTKTTIIKLWISLTENQI